MHDIKFVFSLIQQNLFCCIKGRCFKFYVDSFDQSEYSFRMSYVFENNLLQHLLESHGILCIYSDCFIRVVNLISDFCNTYNVGNTRKD